jgi:hypothetical protein
VRTRTSMECPSSRDGMTAASSRVVAVLGTLHRARSCCTLPHGERGCRMMTQEQKLERRDTAELVGPHRGERNDAAP